METMSQFSQLYMSKKSIHIALSLVSVLSFVLVSYSTLFLPLLSTLSVNLFTFSSERNYIFLLCNGILVFIIKNSGSITSTPLVTDHIENSTQVEKTGDGEEEEEEEEERTQHEFTVSVSDNENDENEEEKQENLLDIQEYDNSYCNGDDGGEGEEEDDDDDDEEEEDEERDELNKRCEEFIRRMKHDIQTEATRQLILTMRNNSKS